MGWGRTDYSVDKGNLERPGARREEGGVCFTAAFPPHAEAELLLYHVGEEFPCQVIPLPERDRVGLVSSVRVRIPEGERLEYNYRADGHLVGDPYAEEIRRYRFSRPSVSSPGGESRPGEERVSCGELRCLWGRQLVDVSAASPDIPYEDCVFYKANVRGLTAGRPEGVRHPGTFLGVREYIPYLRELGVNALLLMPVYEFAETRQEEQFYELDGAVKVRVPSGGPRQKNYWGYAPGFYFTPRGSYSATGDPCREMAEMTRALHEAGMQVILEFYFAPDCGGRLVTDVLRHWLLSYGVDGFHLVGQGEWITSVLADPLLKQIKILFQEFPAPGSRRKSGLPGFRQKGIYSPVYERAMRRFLKGDMDCNPEEIASLLIRNDICCGYLNFMADQDGFTMADMVAYQEKHNEANGQSGRDGTDQNYTWNCGAEGPSRKKAVRGLRRRQLRNAFLLLMTSQGSPMIYAGDEVLNSQDGNNNAWCQDNPIGWVSWKKNKDTEDMLAFVKNCIRFRRDHPVLRQRMPLRMEDYRKTGYPDISFHSHTAWMYESGQTKAGIGVLYCGQYAEKEPGTADDMIYIAYNMYWRPQTFAVPDLPPGQHWYRKVDTSSDEGFYPGGGVPETGLAGTKVFEVPARTVVILLGK